MEITKILNYLKDIAANNNRDWYQAHKAEYQALGLLMKKA